MQRSLDLDVLDPNLSARLTPDIVTALVDWQQRTRAQLTFESWLTEGHTTAIVALVLVRLEAGNPLKIILKACPPHRQTAREPKRHAAAFAEAPPAFSRDHMVAQLFESVRADDNWQVLFQGVAGDSFRTMRPLAAFRADAQLPLAAAAISGSLLSEWNEQFDVAKTRQRDFLAECLASLAELDSPLHQFGTELKDPIGGASHLQFGDAVPLPNPLYWLVTDECWAGIEPANILLGRVHGDLHPGNVIIPVAPAPNWSAFRLIDLSAYRSAASLTIDPIHLVLSVIADNLPLSPEHRRQLIQLLVEKDFAAAPIYLRGLAEVAEAAVVAGDSWVENVASTLSDDWKDQWTLGMVPGALEFVARSEMLAASRVWFLELAAASLAKYVRDHGKEQPIAEVVVVSTATQLPSVVATEAASEVLVNAASFDRSRVTIGIFSSSMGSVSSAPQSCPWDVILDFDTETARQGCYAATSATRSTQHLITHGQQPTVGPAQTLWIAARGLAERPETLAYRSLREWRSLYRPLIDATLRQIGTRTTKPVTLVVFGDSDSEIRVAVEAAVDEFESRVQVVHVAGAHGNLDDYTDNFISTDPVQVLQALDCDSARAEKDVPTLPGTDGPIVIDEGLLSWLADAAEPLTSLTGLTTEVEDVGEGFYRGRTISWFELGLGIDVMPRLLDPLVAQIRSDLRARDTTRLSLLHFPGAGGSTLGRHVAWELHHETPTLYVQAVRDEIALADRIAALTKVTGHPILIILESTVDTVADRLFARLRGDSMPCVMVMVSRRLLEPQLSTDRSFYLGVRAPTELYELANRFGGYAPAQRSRLQALAGSGGPNAVPFFFGLTAFEDSYQGLEQYVAQSLAGLEETHRQVLILLALAHRFAGLPLPEALFVDVLGLEARGRIQLETRLPTSARVLLTEEGQGSWRTSHWLIAGEVLRQLLGSGASAEGWRQALAGWSVQLINLVAATFPNLPDPVRDVLDRLFIVRDNREAVGAGRNFSELLTQVPELPGRLEIMRRLTEAFPSEAHYWAHLARLLNYEADDPTEAMAAIDRALSLDTEDSVLHHIRGMIFRAMLRRESDARIGDQSEAEILRFAGLALSEFDEASRLEELSEYAPVASVQVVVDAIEAGFRLSKANSHAEFLTKATSSEYRELLGQAEQAVESIRELTAGSKLSRFADEAIVELNRVYDDYSALLQGLNNLLDRRDVLRAPIRRRIVRTYVARAGSWDKIDRAEIVRATEMLELNLRDDPSDWASLRDWLRLGRITNASLDRAAELVAFWAQESGSRESLYYDYVLSALRLLGGRLSVLPEFRRKLDRCRERASSFGNRKFSYEWLGNGDGLGMLVSQAELFDWEDRTAAAPDPPTLRRVEASVDQISSPRAGTLRLAGGVQAFFTPAVAGALPGKDENRSATCLVGFSYDGLRAWSVALS